MDATATTRGHGFEMRALLDIRGADPDQAIAEAAAATCCHLLGKMVYAFHPDEGRPAELLLIVAKANEATRLGRFLLNGGTIDNAANQWRMFPFAYAVPRPGGGQPRAGPGDYTPQPGARE